MDEMTCLYDNYDGDLHYIMNNFKITDEDFDFLMDLKSYRNE